MKQTIRNKVNDILAESRIENFTLFYSSLLDQLYVLYILIISGALLLVAHLSIWPILVLLLYIIIAYLFGAYRNHSIAVTATQLIVINGRTPFTNLERFELSEIISVRIGKNLHPILDRLFIIPSNVYIQILFKDNKTETFYTNIDFANEAKPGELTLEDFVSTLSQKNLDAQILEEEEWYD